MADVSLPLLMQFPENGMQVARFSFHETDKPLRLLPALADRSVVVRLELPPYIPSGEEVTLFVSTTL